MKHTQPSLRVFAQACSVGLARVIGVAGLAVAAALGGCSGPSAGEPENTIVLVPGPNNTTIAVAVPNPYNPRVYTMTEATKNPTYLQSNCDRIMADLAAGRKTMTTLSAEEQEILKMLLAERQRLKKKRES